MRIKSISSVFYKSPRAVDPEKTIEELGVKVGDKIADFGAGVGFWTIPLSKIVGRSGKIYALSANDDFVGLLKKKIEIAGLNNIDVVRFSLEEGSIPIKEKVDLVLMVNVLHVIKDKKEALRRASKLIGKNGRVVVIDYLKQKTLFGPPVEYRISEEDLILMAGEVGLEFKCILKETGWHHYGMIFTGK